MPRILRRSWILYAPALLCVALAGSACKQDIPPTGEIWGDTGEPLTQPAPRPWTGGEGEAARPPVDGNGMFIRVYDVRDLLHPLDDHPARFGRDVNADDDDDDDGLFGGDDDDDAVDEGVLRQQDTVKKFLDLIRSAVAPESWTPKGAAMMQETDRLLVVKQTPAAHRQLDRLFSELRKNLPQQISVELRAFGVPAGALKRLWKRQPAWLGDAELKELTDRLDKDEESVKVTTLRVTLLDGHEAYISFESLVDYVTTDPPLAPGPNGPGGVVDSVRATASADRKHITLSCRYGTAVYAPTTQPDELREWKVLHRQEVGSTVVVPDRRTAVWTWTHGKRGLLLLVRPEILEKIEELEP